MKSAMQACYKHGISRRTGVVQVNYPVPGAFYESALVFGLPPYLELWIRAVREMLPLKADPLYQLVPHLTLLYLGRLPGETLLALHKELNILRPVSLHAQPGELGTFEKDGRVINVHLEVKSNDHIIKLHRRAVDIYLESGLQPQTKYTGELYKPHISIFDGLSIPASGFRVPGPIPLPCRDALCLEDLHFIMKAVD